MTEFFRTRMGHRFYEQTMPELVKQLARLNDNLDRLIERLPKPQDGGHQPPDGEVDSK